VWERVGKDVEEEMLDLIGGEGCMRRVIDQAMDGAEQRWECEEDEEACQRCQGRTAGGTTEEGGVADERVEFEQQVAARRRLGWQEMERQSREAQEVEGLVELMEKWRVGCQWCRGLGKEGEGHELEECCEEGGREASIGYERFEEHWVYVPYSCCYDCKLPQAICRSFEMDVTDGGYRKQSGRTCQYEGVLGKVLAVAMVQGGLETYGVLEQAMEEDGGVKEMDEEEVGGPFRRIIQWASEKKRWGGIEGNKISCIIYRVVESAGLVVG
jgi:hypothetical protein